MTIIPFRSRGIFEAIAPDLQHDDTYRWLLKYVENFCYNYGRKTGERSDANSIIPPEKPASYPVFEKRLLSKILRKARQISRASRIVSVIRQTLTANKCCSVVFLSSSQAFYRVRYKELLYKIVKILSTNMYIIKSYIKGLPFPLKYKSFTSKDHLMKAGTRLGSVHWRPQE